MIIDGKKEAQLLRDEIKKEIESIKSKNNKVPGLSVILIGDFAPSQIYVKNKEKNAKEVGINSEVVKYPKDVSKSFSNPSRINPKTDSTNTSKKQSKKSSKMESKWIQNLPDIDPIVPRPSGLSFIFLLFGSKNIQPPVRLNL